MAESKLTTERWLDDLIACGRALYDACVPIMEDADAATVEEWKALHIAFAHASLFRDPTTIKAALQLQGGSEQ